MKEALTELIIFFSTLKDCNRKTFVWTVSFQSYFPLRLCVSIRFLFGTLFKFVVHRNSKANAILFSNKRYGIWLPIKKLVLT